MFTVVWCPSNCPGRPPQVCPGRSLALAEIHAMLRVMSCDYDWSILNRGELPETVRSFRLSLPSSAVQDNRLE